jgi:hypothetical protein
MVFVPSCHGAFRYGGFLNLGAIEVRYSPSEWQETGATADIFSSPLEVDFESFTTVNHFENFTLATKSWAIVDLENVNDVYAWKLQNKLYFHLNTRLSLGASWQYAEQNSPPAVESALLDTGHSLGILARWRW